MKLIQIQEIHIVQFDDGKFFNGVKGHVVRKSNNAKDAKIIPMGKLSDRDSRYLEGKNYRIINVRFTCEEIEED